MRRAYLVACLTLLPACRQSSAPETKVARVDCGALPVSIPASESLEHLRATFPCGEAFEVTSGGRPYRFLSVGESASFYRLTGSIYVKHGSPILLGAYGPLSQSGNVLVARSSFGFTTEFRVSEAGVELVDSIGWDRPVELSPEQAARLADHPEQAAEIISEATDGGEDVTR